MVTTSQVHRIAASSCGDGTPARSEASRMVRPDASSRNSMSTTTRASKTVAGLTGRLSRQSTPRASRHHALTPNSSAPPEATSPGRIVSCGQSRPPATPTRPGPTASTRIPRRIGTTRQTEPRSMRSNARKSDPAVGRGVLVSLSIRSSSRGCRRAARCADTPPSATSTGRRMTRDRRRHDPQRPVPVDGRHGRRHDADRRQGVEERPEPAGEVEPAGDEHAQPADGAHDRDPGGPAADGLGRPGHDLGRRRRGENPEQR